ncbi:MAG: protease complex subunit PrcB family protein [Cytophagales bacterium]|nr:MAG: protease complex subunit PrcB family protein [Cytophagales bacterium]TAF59836.1 MAG: protease complex subunit PrcB family protein [Cytophagales bacterium]
MNSNHIKSTTILLLLVALVYVMSACKSSASATSENIAFQTVFKDNFTPLQEGCFVLNSAQDFAQLKDENFIKRLSNRDLTNETLLVIVQKQRNSGGYSTEITSVENKKTQVVVNYKENSPAAGDMTSAAITYPTVVVSLPKITKKVVFKNHAAR